MKPHEKVQRIKLSEWINIIKENEVADITGLTFFVFFICWAIIMFSINIGILGLIGLAYNVEVFTWGPIGEVPGHVYLLSAIFVVGWMIGSFKIAHYATFYIEQFLRDCLPFLKDFELVYPKDTQG